MAICYTEQTVGKHMHVYYSEESVIGESSNVISGRFNSIYDPFQHRPIIPGTLSGEVYCEGQKIQKFHITADGKFVFAYVGEFEESPPPIRAIPEGSSLDLEMGVLCLKWGADKKKLVAPKNTYVVVDYDYDLGKPISMEQLISTKFVELEQKLEDRCLTLEAKLDKLVDRLQRTGALGTVR